LFEKLEAFRVNTFDVGNQLPFHVRDAALAAAGAGERDRAAIADVEGLRARQRAVREGIAASLGGLPPTDTPLRARTTGVLRGDGHSVEKVIFESRPGVPVTGNLYLPDGLARPSGAVLFLCGHREPAKHHDEYQTVCLYLVSAGLIVLAIDPFGQGERFGFHDPATGRAPVTSVWEHEQVHRQCLPLGDGVARYMLHDALRAVDYLCGRPEVDPARIGVTGHSGGGTQTALMMMYDARIAAAAPGGFLMPRPHFLMTGKTQDGEQRWPGFSALGFDHEDALLAMAPRPTLLLATTADALPIEAPRHLLAVCRRFWGVFGCAEDLELCEDAGGHRFSVPLARATARFFARHLLGRAVEPVAEVVLRPAGDLWCTAGGQVMGGVPGAKNVHQEVVARLAGWRAAREAAPDQKERALAWLRAAVRGPRRPVPANPRDYPSGEVEGLRVTRSLWWSQEGLVNMGYWFREARSGRERLPVTVAVWDGGIRSLEGNGAWIRETCATGRAVLVCNQTAVGPLLPHHDPARENPLGPFGVVDRYTDELVWLGDSMAALRTYDVLRAVEVAAGAPDADPADIRLYGRGRYALYASLAALLEPAVREVRTADRPSSVGDFVAQTRYEWADSQAVILPGMLRYFDLEDVDRWLAEEGRSGPLG